MKSRSTKAPTIGKTTAELERVNPPSKKTRSTTPSPSTDELERFNPNNKLLTRENIESILSKLCGYGVRIGSLETYQLAFVHKSVYRKDISPPIVVVEEFMRKTGLSVVPPNPPLPIATFRTSTASTTKSAPVIFTNTYEAFEFVGDGWINAVIGQYVKSRFPDQSEAFYHNLKKFVVCKDGLARLSARLQFGQYILLSPQAEELLTRSNPSLLEDVFEAFCCAVVEDLGVSVLRVIVKNLIESTIDFRDAIINDDNYKDILKRVCRENGWSNTAQYVDLCDNGKIGAQKEYSVGIRLIPEASACGVKGKTGFIGSEQVMLWATGTGPIKKKAQQAAAYNALKSLELALKM